MLTAGRPRRLLCLVAFALVLVPTNANARSVTEDKWGGWTGTRCSNGSCKLGASQDSAAPGRRPQTAPARRPSGPVVGSGGGSLPGRQDDRNNEAARPGFGGLPSAETSWGLEAPGPAPAPAPAVAPAVVAQQALEELELPEPRVRLNPDEEVMQVVRVPTWMWVDRAQWGPVSESVSVPGVTVKATARPRSVVWEMGDGATVRCQGAGTPYRRGMAAERSSPDCGHTYTTSSAGRPKESFTVVVSMVWDVEWAGGGERGEFVGLTSSSELPVKVAEVQAVVSRR